MANLDSGDISTVRETEEKVEYALDAVEAAKHEARGNGSPYEDPVEAAKGSLREALENLEDLD